MRTCPQCAEEVAGTANVCRFCGHEELSAVDEIVEARMEAAHRDAATNNPYAPHGASIDQEAIRSYVEPYHRGGWQANPMGVSGRIVRGFRHWRNKR
jgi:hypothetical protein